VAVALLAATVGVGLACSSSHGGTSTGTGDAGSGTGSGTGTGTGSGHGDAGTKPPLSFTPSNVDPARNLKGVTLSTLPKIDISTSDCALLADGSGFSCYTGGGFSYATTTQSQTQALLDTYYVDSLTIDANGILRLTRHHRRRRDRRDRRRRWGRGPVREHRRGRERQQ
jgi:hypothetical protein